MAIRCHRDKKKVAVKTATFCVRNETRTHTSESSLPPQSSASTNSAIRTIACISKLGGAKNGTRTRDPDLGKVVLYQLSYFRD